MKVVVGGCNSRDFLATPLKVPSLTCCAGLSLPTYHLPLMPTTLYISGSRLAENFRAVENVAGADATVLAVVKADAYGHGAALCAPVLAAAGARWMGVGKFCMPRAR